MRRIYFLSFLFFILPLERASVAQVNGSAPLLDPQCYQKADSNNGDAYQSVENNYLVSESMAVVNLDSIENLILQGDTDTYISFYYDLFDNPNYVDWYKRLFYSYVMAEWYDYGPANTRLYVDIIQYIKLQSAPLPNTLVCFARHYAHQSFDKDPSWFTASQLSLWYAGTYVLSEKDDQKSKNYAAIARSFVTPSEQ